MVKGQTHVRTMAPCAKCVHRDKCAPFLHRLSEVVVWEHVHNAGFTPPTVLVDCDGRFTPPARYRPVRIRS